MLVLFAILQRCNSWTITETRERRRDTSGSRTRRRRRVDPPEMFFFFRRWSRSSEEPSSLHLSAHKLFFCGEELDFFFFFGTLRIRFLLLPAGFTLNNSQFKCHQLLQLKTPPAPIDKLLMAVFPAHRLETPFREPSGGDPPPASDPEIKSSNRATFRTSRLVFRLLLSLLSSLFFLFSVLR